jgi:putative methionine-R-sulfoxide reductase with GAF domain
MFTERRSCVRHKVNGPVFASFDGVTGGMILDLSDQGLSMQTVVPLSRDRHLHLRLDLSDSEAQLETTGYIAWADALGRAGVRFSDLPEEARRRLDRWLTLNDQAPSRKAPKLTVDGVLGPTADGTSGSNWYKTRSVSLEAGASQQSSGAPATSSSIQYEFHSLGPDLNAALRVIAERARSLLRGSGAAIALVDRGPMMCRASVGKGGPPLGTRVDANAGFTGECIRSAKALRCDDSESDSRVDADICRHLKIRSIAAAPVRYESEVVGLIEVFAPHTFAFDEGDLAVLERLAQTVLLTVSQTQPVRRQKPRRSPVRS